LGEVGGIKVRRRAEASTSLRAWDHPILATIRGVESLILKLLVTPALIGAASLASRRWGTAVGGWLVGIPLTSAPIALFLALDHGPSFAASASVGMLLGTISQAIFCVAYSFSATLGVPWLASFGSGCVGFAASTFVLQLLSVPLVPACLATLIALAVALFFVPRAPDESDGSEGPATSPPRWDIPARMAVATVFVVLLTAVAPVLGPYLSGLLSPFPLFGAVLVVFVYRSEGATSAMRLLRSLLFGLFAPAGFFVALSALIEPLGIGLGFAAATATALVAQGFTLRMLRPGTLSG
jgi:uncharacterized membrane protein (GlpM family)